MLRDTPAAPAGRATTRSATPSPSARDILLAQQFDIGFAATPPGEENEEPPPPDEAIPPPAEATPGAEGTAAVSCRADLDRLEQADPEARRRVWVTSVKDARGASGAVAAGLGEVSLLCLQGFPSGPITVTVKAGGRTYTTAVKPVAELSDTLPAMDDLFNGRPMEVEDVGGGLLESGSWQFLPSEPALTDIARSRGFTVAARSGAVRAESEVPLSVPRGAATMEGWERNHRIAVYGYPAGARVPIGLYSESGVVATLQREVGRVVMPRHQVAIFTVPPDVFRTVDAEPAGDENPACLSVAELAACVT
ncbi:hypothetical protein [Streptomyces sp. NPDC004050]